MRRFNKLITILLIETFFLSSLLPFGTEVSSKQRLLTQKDKLAPPLRLGQQAPAIVKRSLSRARLQAEPALSNPNNLTLRTFLAGLAGFQDAISAVSIDLKNVDAKTADTFFDIVSQIAGLARDFETRNPSYKPAYIYESLCFANIDGVRRLGLVVTPFESRRMAGTHEVLVFDARSEGNYKKYNVDVKNIDMLSHLAERLGEKDIISLALKFRPEYLDIFNRPQMPREVRGKAKEIFEAFLSSATKTNEILDKAQNKISELGSEHQWIKERIERLRRGGISKEEIDKMFLEVMMGSDVMRGKPQQAQYILYTGDATRFWYDLLLDFRLSSSILQNTISEMEIAGRGQRKDYSQAAHEKARAEYVQNAYEEAVAALWVYLHRDDFGTPKVERAVRERTGDFEPSLVADSLGSAEVALGRAVLETIACADCIGSPCSHGPLGSQAADLERKADYIAFIEKARMVLFKELKEKDVKGISENMSLEELAKKIKFEEREELLSSIYSGGKVYQIEAEEIAVWAGMKKDRLEKAEASLRKKAEEIKEMAIKTQEPHCPLEVQIPDMLRLLRQGKLKEAILLVNEKSFLAGIFGLICPQEYLCQAVCTLVGILRKVSPIDIGKIEYLMEFLYLRLYGNLPKPDMKEATGKSAAIIGSGPAGLQAAYDLAREGHKVVIFEHLHEAGGVLVYGIPTFRLPPELLKAKIKLLEDMGVRFVKNTIIGENGAYTIDELRASFDTVIIGVGAGQSNVMSLNDKVVVDEQSGRARLEKAEGAKKTPIPGRILNGIDSAYRFLSWTNIMNARKAGYKTPIPFSKRVVNAFSKSFETGEEVEVNIVVEGMGNVALDCGRTALRWINDLNGLFGTKVKPKIIFLYRRPSSELSLKARDEELHHAMEEAVKGVMEFELYQLHQAVEYVDDETGHVGAIKCIRFDKPGATEGELVEVKADMVIESLGSKPATEILGHSIPLDRYGYIRISNFRTMQVEGLDGSDGRAPVYAVGDCAQAGEVNERIMGTAVLAAMQGKRAGEATIKDLAGRAPMQKRAIDIEKTFFEDKPYSMYEIVDRREIGKREITVKRLRPQAGEKNGVISIQRIIEFIVYAPHVARRIRPGQFVTIMADEFGEKIPITYAGHGEIPGTIHLAIQDMGDSTVAINKIEKGESFYAITGPAGEPSVFAGLAGEAALVGMGSGIAAIVAIAIERAKLGEVLTGLIKSIDDKEDAGNMLPVLEEVFSRLRLPEDRRIDGIIEAVKGKDYGKARGLLNKFSSQILSEIPEPEYADTVVSQVSGSLRDLIVTIDRMIEMPGQDEEGLNLAIKQEAYPALDEVWKNLELLQKERALKEIKKLIQERDYKTAKAKLSGITGSGFKTKVFLAARDKNLLIYKEEIEKAIGKENIFIALENTSGFDAHGEGYADMEPHKNRFFGGYGTIAFQSYLDRVQNPVHGVLVAGPIAGMLPFGKIVRETNKPDVLRARDVWISTNPAMYCAYGGCLLCLIQMDMGIPWRGCLGPEARENMIIGESIARRHEMVTPKTIGDGAPFAVTPKLDSAGAVANIMQALSEMVYLPLKDGRLLAGVKTKDGSYAIKLVDGVPVEYFQGEALSEIIAMLQRIDWEWLGIADDISQQALYAQRIADTLGWELPVVLTALNLSKTRLNTGEGKALRALDGILSHFKSSAFTVNSLWDAMNNKGSVGTLREEIKTLVALGLVDETKARSPTGAILYELAQKVRALRGSHVGALRSFSFLNEPGHIRIRTTQPGLFEEQKMQVNRILDEMKPLSIDEIFSGKDIGLHIVGMHRIGEFLEIHFSPSDFLRLRELFEQLGDKDKLDEILALANNNYMFVLDDAGKLVAAIIRNEQIQKELLWVEGAPSPKLLTYLMLRALKPGLLPQDMAAINVEDVAEGQGLLGRGAVVPPGTSALHKKGGWSDRTASIGSPCTACGACSLVCPEGAIQSDTIGATKTGRLTLTVNPDMCAGCTLCIDACHLPGNAIKMIQKTDLRPAALSIDDTSEGRAVVIEGESASRFEPMFKEQESGFESLRQALGASQIGVFSVNNDFIQLKYNVGDSSYLISFDRIARRLTLRPLRTFAIVDFNEDNIALAGALKDKGFGAVVILSKGDKEFGIKRDVAKASGIGVYTVEELMGKSDMDVRQLMKDIGLSRFIAADIAPIREILNVRVYQDFNQWINKYTGSDILNAVDFLPTVNLDFNEALEAFKPAWEAQTRSFAPGHMLCPGCGQATDMGFLSDVIAKMNVAPVLIYTTGCLQVSATNFPINSSRWPATHANYTASVGAAAGIWAVYHWHKRMGKDIYGERKLLPVVVQGDGGFAIGLNVTMGSLEQGLPFLLIVENNGGTQNTGAQISTLSMEEVKSAGSVGTKKTPGLDIASVVTGANPNVYFTRVSNSDPEDYKKKLENAIQWIMMGRGPAVIESYNTACPTGWKADPAEGMEESALSIQTAVGRGLLFERMGNHIRLSGGILPRDGNIYVNTPYLISLEYELKHLTEDGRRLLTDEEVGKIVLYINNHRQSQLAQRLKAKKPMPGLPEMDFSMEWMQWLAVSFYLNNIPVNSELFRENLQAFGIDADKIDAIVSYRKEKEFKDKGEIISIIGPDRYNQIAGKALYLIQTGGQLHNLLGHFVSDAPSTAEFIRGDLFGSIEDFGRLLRPETFEKIKGRLTLIPQRPHVIEYYERQGRFRDMLKSPDADEKLERLQAAVENDIAVAKEMAAMPSSVEVFERFDEIIKAGVPLEVAPFKYKSAREAHNALFGSKYAIPEDATRQRRIAERKALLGDKIFKELWVGRAGQGGITAADFLVIFAAMAEGLDVRDFPQFGVARTGAEVDVHVAIGNKIREHNTPVTEPDMVIVIDETLLSPKAFKGLKPGGFILVNTSKSPSEIRAQLGKEGANLPEGVKIFTVDATAIGRKYLGDNRQNIPMLAARILIAQLTDLDFGEPKLALDYIYQISLSSFKKEAADLNYKAMLEAIEKLKVEGGTFEQIRKQTLAARGATLNNLKEKVEAALKAPPEVLKGQLTMANANKAAAYAVAQAGQTKTVFGYPTTPATSVIEYLAQIADMGLPMFVSLSPAEDDVGARLLGAAEAGDTPVTGTTSVAATYMFNQHLPDFVGKELPIVINLVVRAINIGALCIFSDESDMAFIKDWGVFLRARNAQEAYYLNLIALRIARELKTPVFVVSTGFRNSHTNQPVRIFDDYDAIEAFYNNPDRFNVEGTILDEKDPNLIGPVIGPDHGSELVTATFERLQNTSDEVVAKAFADFERLFGVRFSPFIEYRTEDADEIIVLQGDAEESIEALVDELRAQGRKVGVIHSTVVKPFPYEAFRDTITRINPRVITVLDNSKSHFLYDDAVGALKGLSVPVFGPVVYGLMGRDFYKKDAGVLFDTLKAFGVIQGLSEKDYPLALSRELIEELITGDAVPTGEAQIYHALSSRFSELSEPESIFDAKELGIWRSAPPSEADKNAFKKWGEAMYDLEAKMKLQLWLIDSVKDGSYVHLSLDAGAKKMLDTILNKVSVGELETYRRVASVSEEKAGAKNLFALLELIDQAGNDMRHPQAHLKRDSIIDRLISGGLLELFSGGHGRTYFYGVRRDYDQYNLLHNFVVELSIRLSRKLLEENLGTSKQRLMATECLLDLSKITGDFKVAADVLKELTALKGNPPEAERAKELLQINRERFKQL